MPRGRKPKPRVPLRPLSEQERAELERAVRARNVPKSLDQRASIVLAAAAGHDDREIARQCNCDPRTVRKWIERFNAQGLAGLADAPRPGQPWRYTAQARLQAVALLSQSPAEVLGAAAAGRTTWTLDLLAQALLAGGYTHRLVPPSLLHHWLCEAGVSFKQAKRWLHSKDPEFEPKKGQS